MINNYMIILDIANWVLAYRNRQSPFTSLFFDEKGNPYSALKAYWSNCFVISGIQNEFASNAQNVLNSFRFFGVYLCSSECDFIYMIGNCGYTSESFDCGYCGEPIGNKRGAGGHTLARKEQGARRLGPDIGDSNYIGGTLNSDHKYWDSLGKDILGHLQKTQEKREVKTKVKGVMATVPMTGFSRILRENIDFLHRISKVTDIFQRLLVHSMLLFNASMGWVDPKEVAATIALEEADSVEYLSKSSFSLIDKLEKLIELPDSIVWVLAIVHKLKAIICESAALPSSYANREVFEKAMDQAIAMSMRDRAKDLINTHRRINNAEAVMALDLILREDKLSPLYIYLKGFRLNKIPNPTDMMVEYEADLLNLYPLIDICMKSCHQIERVYKLYDIIPFTIEVARLADFSITRERAKSLSIKDFIAEQPADKQPRLRNMLRNFLAAWRFLSVGGPIQYECKTLGLMAPYDQETPVIGFLIDTIELNNEFGKILAGLITMLSESQNQVLASVTGRTKNLPRYKYVEIFDENIYLPQNLKEGDLISINEEYLHKVIIEHSTNRLEYGNSVAVYDFRGIEDQLLLQLQGRKKFDTDISHYRNVRFVG